MHPTPDRTIQGASLRVLFDEAVISRPLPRGATFGDVAMSLGGLDLRRFGQALAIDMTLAPAPRRN